jgi:hypothetical protein
VHADSYGARLAVHITNTIKIMVSTTPDATDSRHQSELNVWWCVTHLMVDEYQDCSETHHAFVASVRRAVPAAGILGDPLQAIFGFNERLADWETVLVEFPPHPTTVAPRRWAGHNEALGKWLFDIRPFLVPGHVVRWKSIALPEGVTFQNVSGN